MRAPALQTRRAMKKGILKKGAFVRGSAGGKRLLQKKRKLNGKILPKLGVGSGGKGEMMSLNPMGEENRYDDFKRKGGLGWKNWKGPKRWGFNGKNFGWLGRGKRKREVLWTGKGKRPRDYCGEAG